MINVHLLNSDSECKKPYELVFANRASSTCKLVIDEKADIGILDVDYYNNGEWKRIRDNKDYPVILISSNHLTKENLSISKPVKFSELLCLISEQISCDQDETGTFKAASAAASKIEDNAKTRVIHLKHKHHTNRFKTENFIIGYLSEVNCRSDLKAITLFQWKGRWLIVSESEKKIFTNINKNILNHLSTIPIEEISRKIVTHAEAKTYLSSTKMFDTVENTIWNMAPYLAGQGLPHNLDLEKSYRLDAWPNFTQYPTASIHLAIASHWIDNACSISYLMGLFDISIEEISTFVISCHLCGFLIDDDINHNSSLTTKPKNAMTRVFNMMLDCLSA